MTSKLNEQNIQLPRDEEGDIDVKNGKYDTNNQLKKATFKYEKEGRFCLGVAKIKIKNGMITGKRCPVFGYSGEKIVTIDAYKKKKRKNLQEFESLLHHRHSGSKKQKQTRYVSVNL